MITARKINLQFTNNALPFARSLNTPIARAAIATGLHFSCPSFPRIGGSLLEYKTRKGNKAGLLSRCSNSRRQRVMNSPTVVFPNANDRGNIMTNLLTLSDINTSVNHEPRILDVRLAEALGFERPADIRPLIARHDAALKRLGEVFRTVRKTTSKGGRPTTETYLNKKQAAYIAAKSETENAIEITVHVIEVFDAATRPTLPAAINEAQSNGYALNVYDLHEFVESAIRCSQLMRGLSFMDWALINGGAVMFPAVSEAAMRTQKLADWLAEMRAASRKTQTIQITKKLGRAS